MSFEFISTAYAQGSAPGGSDLMTFLPMIAIFVVFYFLLIRPQQKRQRDTDAMLKAIDKNDRVTTAGGLQGKVVGITDDVLTVEIAVLKSGESIRVKVSRAKVDSVAKGKKDDES